MPVLRVISGPDLGATAEVDQHPVSIGRGSDCGLRVTDEFVSLIHSLVEPVEGGFRLRDLESSNGTIVNGESVTELSLRLGDLISLGKTTILFGSGNEETDIETVGSAETPMPGDLDLAP